MKLIIIACGLFCVLGCKTLPQEKHDVLQLEEVHIYRDTVKRGYTTVGAYMRFDDLRRNAVALIPVTTDDRIRLQEILIKAKTRRHYQTKVGRPLFCEVVFHAGENAHRFIMSGVHETYNLFGKKKQGLAIVTDLTSNINYVITDKDELEWLSWFYKKGQINGNVSSTYNDTNVFRKNSCHPQIILYEADITCNISSHVFNFLTIL